MTDDDRAIARAMRVATWVALPAVALLARRSSTAARALTGLAIGTLGVAHGASDDLILIRLLPGFPGGRVAISAAYAAATLGVMAAAWRAPTTADRALSLVTWYHFGSGDVALARVADERESSIFEAFVRGAIPLCGRDTDRRTGMGAIAAATALACIVRGDIANALDVALPASVIATASAPFGFATYFGFWHAPRHLALVLARAGSNDGFIRRLTRFSRESARNVGLALALGAVVFARGRNIDSKRTFVALTLGVTVPHQLAVWFAERCARLRDEHMRGSSGELAKR